jgi:metal-responsive CopG/Arc/MetJ family transcriptional regulator
LEESYGTVAGMARKQVIVQLDDGLVDELDRLAAMESVSRSEILRRASREYLDSSDERRKEQEMIEAYRRCPQDPDEVQALHRVSLESWPEW